MRRLQCFYLYFFCPQKIWKSRPLKLLKMGPNIFFSVLPTGPIQPKSQFLFHKNLPTRDFFLMTVQVHVIFCQTAQCKWMLAALASTTEPDFDYLEDKKFWNFLANISQKLPQCSISGLESQFLASRHNSLTRLQRAFLVHYKRPLSSVHDFLIVVHTVLFLIFFIGLIDRVWNKVIIDKSRGGRFLWSRNWDLGWIWANWQ